MKKEDSDREKRRKEFEHATWARANKQKYGGDWPVLYDAGDLGFCLLEWSSSIGGAWRNRWFDKALKLKPNEKLTDAGSRHRCSAWLGRTDTIKNAAA